MSCLIWYSNSDYSGVEYPGIYLARGNHESKSLNKIYGFEGEVKAKFNQMMVELFAEVFCCLPLAHVLNNKVFVTHGGLFSKDDVKLSDIRSIDRFVEPPDEGDCLKNFVLYLAVVFLCWSWFFGLRSDRKYVGWAFYLAFISPCFFFAIYLFKIKYIMSFSCFF